MMLHKQRRRMSLGVPSLQSITLHHRQVLLSLSFTNGIIIIQSLNETEFRRNAFHYFSFPPAQTFPASEALRWCGLDIWLCTNILVWACTQSIVVVLVGRWSSRSLFLSDSLEQKQTFFSCKSSDWNFSSSVSVYELFVSNQMFHIEPRCSNLAGPGCKTRE